MCHPLTKYLIALVVISLAMSDGLYAAPEYISDEASAPGSVKEEKAPMAEAFVKKEPEPTLFPRLKEKLRTLPPFLRDTSLAVKPRNYYFARNNVGEGKDEAWAQGGSLSYRSGLWKDRIHTGMVLYTSQKLYGPEERDGTLLLRSRQNSLSVIGEAYLQVKVVDETFVKLYRQSFNLPYINRQDSRMIPNTFEAYGVGSVAGPRFNYIAAHLTKMKQRNSSDFVSMSEAAGAPGTDKDLSMAAARYSFDDDKNIGVITQQSWDVMNTTYAEAHTAWDISPQWEAKLAAQYTRQQSVGDELIGDFDTHSWGVKGAASYKGGVITVAYTSTDEDGGIQKPFGGSPSYLSLMVSDFDRAGESGWLLGISSDFRSFGINGWSAFIKAAWGDTPDSGLAASPDQRELDITVDYRFQRRLLKGLWIRARAAFLAQENGPEEQDVNEFRIIANYEIPIL